MRAQLKRHVARSALPYRAATARTTAPNTAGQLHVPQGAACACGGGCPSCSRPALQSEGEPLDGSTLSRMERSFGESFEGVRVHTGSRADDFARSVHAVGATIGSDVYFAAGRYRPGTPDGDHLLAHELVHTLQHRRHIGSRRPSAVHSSGAALGLGGGGPTVHDSANAAPEHRTTRASPTVVLRQEEGDERFRKIVIANPRLDVRAQFALLRLLRSTPERAAIARSMIDEIDKETLNGIYGDDLKKAAEIAALRGTVRWELVPKGKDAVYIHDANPDSPVMVFREAAGHKPRLDDALVDAYHAQADPADPFCISSTNLPPACTFNEAQRLFLERKLDEARDRTLEVRRLLGSGGGRDIAQAAATNLFSDPVPEIAEIEQAIDGVLAVLSGQDIRFACRTCGDLDCQRSGVVAYVFNPGQMPINICVSRLFAIEFINQVTRTIIHEAVHLSGIDTDRSKDEAYCENVPRCDGPCHGKDNAETWARYIDCLGEPMTIPPLILPRFFPPPIPLPAGPPV